MIRCSVFRRAARQIFKVPPVFYFLVKTLIEILARQVSLAASSICTCKVVENLDREINNGSSKTSSLRTKVNWKIEARISRPHDDWHLFLLRQLGQHVPLHPTPLGYVQIASSVVYCFFSKMNSFLKFMETSPASIIRRPSAEIVAIQSCSHKRFIVSQQQSQNRASLSL